MEIYEQLQQKGLKKTESGKIDGCAGGFPCQGNSTAGKRKGKADDRYLWPEMARITREINARWMVGENVRGILSVDGGELFGDVLRDLAEMGRCAGWSCYGACDVGASHKRERVFILAHSASAQWQSGTKEQRILRTLPENEREQYNVNRPSETCNLMWPTPKYSLRADCPCERKRKTPDLAAAVKMWTTPAAQDGKNSTLPSSQKDRDSVVGAVMRGGHKGQLNPDWVECLMGFPIGWTDIECDNPKPWPGNPAYMGHRNMIMSLQG